MKGMNDSSKTKRYPTFFGIKKAEMFLNVLGVFSLIVKIIVLVIFCCQFSCSILAVFNEREKPS